jgi:putative protein-disulfide isomerase
MMAQPHLIYVADPMCSWCWGFSPVVDAIRSRFGEALPIRLVLGGLRPGTTDPLTPGAKQTMREHWDHVHDASGQPFDMRFFDRSDYVYDTEPASRAVVVIRRGGDAGALDLLRAIHHAFYADNQDVTDRAVLAELAGKAGHDQEVFLRAFDSKEAKRETWTDFAIAQRSGITGFPTLLAGQEPGAEYAVAAQGYQPPGRILPLIEAWLQGLRGRPGSSV